MTSRFRRRIDLIAELERAFERRAQLAAKSDREALIALVLRQSKLCGMIEQFPCSEHQTATSVQASDIRRELSRLACGDPNQTRPDLVAAPVPQAASRDEALGEFPDEYQIVDGVGTGFKDREVLRMLWDHVAKTEARL